MTTVEVAATTVVRAATEQLFRRRQLNLAPTGREYKRLVALAAFASWAFDTADVAKTLHVDLDDWALLWPEHAP